MPKSPYFLLLFLTWHLHASAQEPLPRTYATQAYQATIAENDTAYIETRSAMERFTASYLQDGHPDTITIAVVFHLLCPPGSDVPTSRDIVLQVEQLNRDFFRPEGPKPPPAGFAETGYDQRIGQPLIRFCLPTETPEEDSTAGVVTLETNKTAWGVGDSIKRTEEGGSTTWNAEHYLNVWVAPLADTTSGGYAQMPGGPAATDGIVLNLRYFAREEPDSVQLPFARGRTLVHLVGSYLNLYELWDDTQPCADDYVADTPLHNAANYGEPVYQHVSLCTAENEVEMTMNLMDNTIDTAQYLFTPGQVMRLQATLAEGGPRGLLRQTPTACSDAAEALLPLGDPRQAPGQSTAPAGLQGRLYPNPASGDALVELSSVQGGRLQVHVFNSLGQLAWQSAETVPPGTTQIKLPARDWPAGWYTVRVIVGEEQWVGRIEKR